MLKKIFVGTIQKQVLFWVSCQNFTSKSFVSVCVYFFRCSKFVYEVNVLERTNKTVVWVWALLAQLVVMLLRKETERGRCAKEGQDVMRNENSWESCEDAWGWDTFKRSKDDGHEQYLWGVLLTILMLQVTVIRLVVFVGVCTHYHQIGLFVEKNNP